MKVIVAKYLVSLIVVAVSSLLYLAGYPALNYGRLQQLGGIPSADYGQSTFKSLSNAPVSSPYMQHIALEAYLAEGDVNGAAQLAPSFANLNTRTTLSVIQESTLGARVGWWRYAMRHQQTQAAQHIQQSIRNMSLGLLLPAPKNEQQQAVLALPHLVEQGIWTHEQAVRVALLWSWKSAARETLAAVLEIMVAHYPDHPEWEDVQSEHRQRLRLPNTLSRFPAVQYGEWNGQVDTGAVWASGIDDAESPTTLRIDGIRWEVTPENGAPYAEFNPLRLIRLQPNKKYSLSFRYKTSNLVDGNAFVAFLDYVSPPRLIIAHQSLPETHGAWQTWQHQFITPSDSQEIPLTLILRSLGLGTVWFDDVQLLDNLNQPVKP